MIQYRYRRRNLMLLEDVRCNNSIIDYDITFDNDSKKIVLDILSDCFNKRKISLPCEETFLLHGDFDLDCLKRVLDKSKGGLHDLLVYYYTFSNPIPKKSEIGGIHLGEEVKITSTLIECPLSSIIAFVLHHLNDGDRNCFINNLNPADKTYIDVLLRLSGSGRLSCLLDTIENIDDFLRKCQCFEEKTKLDDLKLFETILYFKTVFAHSILTPRRSYDKAYLNSIVPIDDMECEEIQNIKDAAEENTKIVKRLRLAPKRIIY